MSSEKQDTITLETVHPAVLEALADTWEQFAEYNDALAETHDREGRHGSAMKAWGLSHGHRDAAKSLRKVLAAGVAK